MFTVVVKYMYLCKITYSVAVLALAFIITSHLVQYPKMYTTVRSLFLQLVQMISRTNPVNS